MHNGPMAILAVPAKPKPGWYGVSRIDVHGDLKPFIRCPGHAKWCGETESIAWAPRGDRLALSVASFGLRNPYNGIHVIDMRTHRDTRIRAPDAPPGEKDWFDLAWSPDGRTLAYVPSGLSHVSSGTIVLVDADGGNRRVLPAPRGHKSSPTWSPDGRSIAFDNRVNGVSSIYRVNLDGGGLRLLARHASAPAWSRRAVIAYHSACGIKLMDGDGTPIVPAAARPCGAIGLPHLAAPVWSPDGKKIAATLSLRMPDQTRGTYVMDANGTNLWRATPATLAVFVGQRPRVAWQPIR
jgi:WD40 repeat protein